MAATGGLLLLATAAAAGPDQPHSNQPRPVVDVAKDPEFSAALVKEVPGLRSVIAAIDDNEPIPQARIRLEHLNKMQTLLKRILRSQVLPAGRTVDQLKYRGYQNGQNEYIVAAWDSNQMRISSIYGPGAYLILRVRITGERSVTSSPFEAAGRRELIALMTRLMQTTYESDADVEVHGVSREILDRIVHTGELGRKGVDVDRLVLEGKQDSIEPFDAVHFLITETTPQYAVFYLWIPDPDAKGWARRPPLFRRNPD